MNVTVTARTISHNTARHHHSICWTRHTVGSWGQWRQTRLSTWSKIRNTMQCLKHIQRHHLALSSCLFKAHLDIDHWKLRHHRLCGLSTSSTPLVLKVGEGLETRHNCHTVRSVLSVVTLDRDSPKEASEPTARGHEKEGRIKGWERGEMYVYLSSQSMNCVMPKLSVTGVAFKTYIRAWPAYLKTYPWLNTAVKGSCRCVSHFWNLSPHRDIWVTYTLLQHYSGI